MVKSCCALNCTNRDRIKPRKKITTLTDTVGVRTIQVQIQIDTSSCVNTPGRSFHEFPKDECMRRLWVSAVSRDDFKPSRSSTVCSDHFLATDYRQTKKRKLLKPNAVPFGRSLKERRKIIKKPVKKSKKKTLPIVIEPKAPPTLTELKLRNDLLKKRKEHKMMKQRVRRKNKKMDSINSVIAQLRKDSMVKDAQAVSLKNNFAGTCLELFENQAKNSQRKGSNGRRYTDEVKQFALTLNFYSPRAYRFIRKVFFLPNPSTIRGWCASVNCEPGLFSEVFTELQRQCENSNAMSDCCLQLDGMSIRQQTNYDKAQDKYSGYVDFGNIVPQDTESLATESLVLMLTGLRSAWKYPVGYFNIKNSVEAEIQAELIRTCLCMAADHGLRVWSVTFDGAPTNLRTLELLGCNFSHTDFNKMKVSFKHPSRDYQVYATPDACHMLKLARNALGDLQQFKDGTGSNISWHFIRQLSVLQDDEGLYLANKLKSHHIKYHNNKMKVKIAAQTLSSSVADALQFLQTDLQMPMFQNCESTITFIRTIDRLFDFLNSRHPAMKGYKSPTNRFNFIFKEEQVLKDCQYLLSLKSLDGQPLVQHRRKTFIIGFVATCKSLLAISKEILFREHDPFRFVLTYKFSQDHIEMLFSCIRSRGGNNNNPNTLQFKTALKQILMKNSITPSVNANALSFEEVFNGSIFSFKSSKRQSPAAELLGSTYSVGKEDKEGVIQLFQNIDSSAFRNNVLYYITGFCVRKVLSKLTCQDCSKALVVPIPVITDHSYNQPSNRQHMPVHTRLYMRKNRGGLVEASNGAYQVIKQCEKSFQVNVILSSKTGITSKNRLLKQMVLQVLQGFDWQKRFPSIEDHRFNIEAGIQDDHLTQLVKRLAITYINLRLLTYGQAHSRALNVHKAHKRQQLNKLTLFMHL